MLNTVILTIHNKEKSITKIIHNLLNSLSKQTSNLILILDGCKDRTEENLNEYIEFHRPKIDIQIICTNDIWETRANNVGLRNVNTEFATIVQDDMLIKHKKWDKIFIDFLKSYEIFAISGRACHEFNFDNKIFKVTNISGREYPFSNNNLFGRLVGKIVSIFKPFWLYKYLNFFSIRLVANRGPLMMKMAIAKKLNFFDESFAPFELDDVDLCCRAYKEFGLLSASNPICYFELNGSKKNNFISRKESEKCILKNSKILFNRHLDLAS